MNGLDPTPESCEGAANPARKAVGDNGEEQGLICTT
jgi:hypothetical protein